MKKALIILMALAVTGVSQAQIGNLVGGAIRKSVEKKISQTVEDKMDDALGNKKTQSQPQSVRNSNQQQQEQTSEKRLPTPEEVMEMVPMPPSYDNLADYACESNRANPRTLKLVANPTSKYLAKMTMALASGYVTMMGSGGNGNVYYYDELLLADLGISQEQFDAMSEEEQEKLAQKYADELKNRYVCSTEWLAGNPEYMRMQEQYNETEKQIGKLYSEAETKSSELWKNKYGKQEKATEEDMCSYFKEAVPVLYKAVTQAMQMRRDKQLPVAKQMDEFVQRMAHEHPHEVYAGFFNQGGLCATSYVSDAARLTTFSDPR